MIPAMLGVGNLLDMRCGGAALAATMQSKMRAAKMRMKESLRENRSGAAGGDEENGMCCCAKK